MQRHAIVGLQMLFVAFMIFVVAVEGKIDGAASDDEHAKILKQYAKGGGNTVGVDAARIKSRLNRTRMPGRHGEVIPGQLREKERPTVPIRPRPPNRTRPSPTPRKPEPESIIGPVPARFKPAPTCQLKATDIFIIVDNNACGSAIVEHSTFRLVRNMVGKMDVRPNGIRIALDTGGRQENRRLTPSSCLDIRCVYEFLHTLVRDTNPERTRFRDKAAVNMQPVVYNASQAATNAYMFDEMTMFSGRTKVLLFLTYGRHTKDEVQLLADTFNSIDSMKKVAMFLSLDPEEEFPYRSLFNLTWRPRVSRLKLMTEAEYWVNRLCQFLKTGRDQAAATTKDPSEKCKFSEVSRGCKMSMMSCIEIIDKIPDDPQYCKAPPPREEECPDYQECMHNCDVNTTPWTNWACFAACEDPADEQEPQMYRNRQLLIGVEPMACTLFETQAGCEGLLPPCPDARPARLRNVPHRVRTQGTKQCKYTTTKICRYVHPGVCNGVEEHRSSSADCPTRRKQVTCETEECDQDCDERTTPWAEWSTCPECAPSEVAKPPIAIRERQLTRKEEVYCITRQGRLCSNLPLCASSDLTDGGLGRPMIPCEQYLYHVSGHCEGLFTPVMLSHLPSEISTGAEAQHELYKRTKMPLEFQIPDGQEMEATECQTDQFREECILNKDMSSADGGPKCSTQEHSIPIEGHSGPNCRTTTQMVECAKEECEAVCDRLSGEWSEWSSCSASCADPSGFKATVIKRRRTTSEQACEAEQIQNCATDLPPCLSKDENALEESEQEMEMGVEKPEEPAMSVGSRGREYSTVTAIIVVLVVMVLIAVIGMAVALYFLRDDDDAM